jgi:kumamolisin
MNQATPATHAVPRRAHLRYLGPHTGTAPIDVTLVLRRAHRMTPAVPAWPARPVLTRGDFARQCGADPADLERLRAFARSAGLTETGADPGRRVLHLRANPPLLQKAFGVTLGAYASAERSAPLVGFEQAPALPPEAIAVLGLDGRPVAHAQFRRPRATPAVTYTPPQLGALYGFPAGTDGTGQAVAVIELGGGFRTADLAQYFRGLGFPKAPSVTAIGVAGGKNQPGSDADGEVMLDIEVIGALAPAAAIAVYFAPNTDRGFYEAISQAAHDTARRPSVISISWGGPEDSWSASSRAAMNSALEDAAALGVSVTVACGDNGSGDGETDTQPHVDFPASSPYALACGGTRLTAVNGVISAEVVWNESSSGEGATGGGVSSAFGLPVWQQGVAVPKNPAGTAGRGVPDVAGNADPMTGYQVLVDGQPQVIGGTSAVAPLWAALLARCNQKLGRSVGDLHAALYQLGTPVFRDITSGNNGAYPAGPGWDACTGLGSPNGAALVAGLAALQAK